MALSGSAIPVRGFAAGLTRIGKKFPAFAGGAVPFDLQNDLRADQVYTQLAGYTQPARELYYAFTLIDYAFPFFAGLFIAATVAFALRTGLPGVYREVLSRKLLLVLLLPTAFDWLENVSAVSVILLYPTEVRWLPLLLVAAKKCKLATLVVSNAAMAGVVLVAAGNWIFQRLHR